MPSIAASPIVDEPVARTSTASPVRTVASAPIAAVVTPCMLTSTEPAAMPATAPDRAIPIGAPASRGSTSSVPEALTVTAPMGAEAVPSTA